MGAADAGAGDALGYPQAGRSGAALLLDRRFGPYLGGKLLSLVGLWAHNLVSAVVAYQVTASVTLVGVVSLAQFGPQLLLVNWSGAIADRQDRLRQLVVGRVLCTCGSLVLGLWCLAGVDRPGTIGVLMGTSAIMGIGLVVGGPAMMALVPSLVRPGEIADAVRLDSLPMLLGRTIGPVAGAIALETFDAGPAFLAAAAGNLVFALVLLAIRNGGSEAARRRSADRSMRAAWSQLRAEPTLALILVGVTATAIGADPSLTLAPAIAEASGAGVATAGTYTAAFGMGAAFGVVMMGLLGRRVSLARLVPVGLVTLAGSNVVLAVPIGLAGSAAAFACGGFGMSLALTACTTLLQLTVRDEFRGRMMSLWLICFVGARPVAALLTGALADVFSVATALIVVGGLVAGSAWLCRPAWITTRRRTTRRSR